MKIVARVEKKKKKKRLSNKVAGTRASVRKLSDRPVETCSDNLRQYLIYSKNYILEHNKENVHD